MYEKKVVILFNVLSFLFYCCDFFALYYSIKTINIIEKMNSNKKENIFFLFVRFFILFSNSYNVSYSILNNIQPLLIINSIYLSFDSILIISRTVYGISIIRLIKQNSQIIIMRPTIGDNNKLYYRPTMVPNPILNNL